MARRFSVKDVLGAYKRPLRKHWLAAFITLTGLTVSYVFSIITPLFYKQLLDLLAANGTVHALLAIVFVILGLNLVSWVFRRAGQLALIKTESATMNELSQEAFASLLRHSYGFFTNNFTGSLARRVNRLSHSFEDVTDRVIFNVLPLIISVIGITFVLFIRNSLLGWLFLAWTGTLLIIQFGLAFWKMRYSIETAEKDSEATGALSDTIGNDTAVKIFTGMAFERERYKKISDELDQLRSRGWRFDEYVNMTQALLGLALEFALMYAAIVLYHEGKLTIGDFVLIQSYIVSAIDQLWNFGNNLRRVYESFADATEMVDIMNLPPEIQDVPNAKTLSVSEGKIEFRDVVFNFNETRSVFSDLNLAIAAKEKIALVGPSGAGKSTITKLILRFHDVTAGGVYIDEQNIAQVTQESLRSQIAFVPQEPALFHRSLMENIRYGRRDATDEEVVEAAKQAYCYDFIMATPEKFNTFVGERGIKLSGGERQRIAIARAILKDAPILILDEATSSLDSESEMLIQDAFARLMEGKTVVAIAHRLSTVMKMDRIVVIEDGKVAMTGTHQELLSHEGSLYKKLWEIQAGGFIENDMGAAE